MTYSIKEDISILIVDDEQDMCDFLTRVFSKQKKIKSCLDPVEGLKKAKKEHYDLILLDYKMPKMNGVEFMEGLIKEEVMPKTKVIVMTAYGDIDVGRKAIEIGASDYIIKPFNIENVIFRISLVMDPVKSKYIKDKKD